MLKENILKKGLKCLKPCFSWPILANTHVYCGEKAVQTSLKFPLISSPFNLSPLAQRHFILPGRVLNPCASTTLSRPSNFKLRPERSSNREFGVAGGILAHSNSATEFECAPWSLHKPVHLNIVQTQGAHDLHHSNHGSARLCIKLCKDIQSQN
jgi:hypothetical protein